MRLNKIVLLLVGMSIGSVFYLVWLNKFSNAFKKFKYPFLNFNTNMPPEIIIQENSRNAGGKENNNERLLQKRLLNDHKSCKLNLQQRSFDAKPLINLDSNHYLVAMSHNGPTNQLLGLRDAIFLSIRLNRTLVLPKFFKVKTENPDGSNVVPAESRFDVSTLAKLMPYKQNDQLQHLCNEGIQQLITGRECSFLEYRDRSVREVLSSLKLPYPVEKDGKPKFVCSKGKRSFYHILEQHNASYKCIAFSFFGLGVSESSNALRKATKIIGDFEKKRTRVNAATLDERTIYSLGLLSTGLPSIVKKLADAFINEFLNRNSFLAIHWRYNPDDWMVHCKHVEKNSITEGDFSKMCYQLSHLKPEDLLHAGINVIDTQISAQPKINKIVKAIYLATPLNQKPVIKSFEKEALRLRKAGRTELIILTSTALKSFLDKYETCISDKNIIKDTLALVEMQLCIQSTIFLHSVKSSWSENVIKERRGKTYTKFNEDILSLAWKQHIKA